MQTIILVVFHFFNNEHISWYFMYSLFMFYHWQLLQFLSWSLTHIEISNSSYFDIDAT